MQDSGKKKIELLAPAGDFDALEAAIYNGADAVYFGYSSFSARANAENFTDLTKVTCLCHLFNVKAYLALNISLKNEEIPEVVKVIEEAGKAKIDAFIITDIALLPIIKEKVPLAEVHASTQTGIHNRYGAKLFEDLGFDRIILSREVTLEDIIDIKKNISIPIEVFVQGAMCVGFSGACLLSSILTGNSGNRGKCQQLCRQEYAGYLDGEKKAEGYLLSPADLCLIDKLDELITAGVSSIKIEGRLRRAEYVAATVAEYRKALDYGFDGDYTTLKKLFNRGNYTNGYLFGDKDIIYPYVQNHIGLNAGKIIKANEKFAVIEINNSIKDNDGFKVLRNGLEVGGFIGKGAKKLSENIYELNNNQKFFVGDTINITTDSELNKELLSVNKKLPVKLDIKLIGGEKSEISASYNDIKINFSGEIVEKAVNQPLSEAVIKEQFSRTGNTHFEVAEITIRTDNAFLTKAGLNELKRNILEKLESKIIDSYMVKTSRQYMEFDYRNEKIEGDYIEISGIGQLTEFLKNNIKNIVYAPYNYNQSDCENFVKTAKTENNKVFLKLPIFAGIRVLSDIEKIIIPFDGLICNNYYGIQLAKEYNKIYVLGYNLNIMNNENIFLKNSGNYIISAELNGKEISKNFEKGIIYAYGYLPLMYFLHCPKRTLGASCGKCNGETVFKDEKGSYNVNNVKFCGKSCQHIMKNGIITDIGSGYPYNLYLDFSDIQDNVVINEVAAEYINKSRISKGKYTLNHLKRGVK